MQKKAIILAAGKGSRMKSDKLKVLHDVAGKPILQHVIDTVLASNVDDIYVVVGHQADDVKKVVNHPKITFVSQEEQLGTGHAVMQAEPFFGDEEADILVLAGDCPLIELETLNKLMAIHNESNAEVTILSAIMDDPGSYGRILRGKMGTVTGIREAKDCNEAQLKIDEINTGIYLFQMSALKMALSKITNNNNQKEYYLTDAIHIIKDGDGVVEAFCTDNADQAVGINTRMDLAKINHIIYQQNNLFHMHNGVTIIDPVSTFIDSTVEIGNDTVIHPFTVLTGQTRVGKNVILGPYTYLNDQHVDEGSEIWPERTTIKQPAPL